MNLRKSTYFKPLCLLVAALFIAQCVSIEKKLVSTEEKVIEDGNHYLYELEKVKTPTAQDPTVEYRIVKFPANGIESINTYKLRKVHQSKIGILLGAAIGSFIGTSGRKEEYAAIRGFWGGILIGSVIGGIGSVMVAGQIKKKSGLIKETIGNYFTKKPGSTPIPVQDFPLEFKWGTRNESYTFKTRTDEQGIVRINLIDDLKIAKFPLDHPLIVYVYYLNPESQKNGILFGDSLGPEKEADKH